MDPKVPVKVGKGGVVPSNAVSDWPNAAYLFFKPLPSACKRTFKVCLVTGESNRRDD